VDKLFIKLIFIIYLLVGVVGTSIAFSQNVLKDSEIGLAGIKPLATSQILSIDEPLPVNDRIISLLELSESEPREAQQLFGKIDAISENFNFAEQYLMLMVRANIANSNGEYQKSINWLNKALAMESKMAKMQLFSPLFSKIHFIFATSLAAIGEYQRAYEQKNLYIEKYRDYRKQIRQQRMKKLNQKYETDLKVKQNELLESQNELKKLQIREADAKTHEQRRNIIVLIVTAVVFLVLLLRQLKIRSTLKFLSKTDSLTGLYNRRTLYESGNALITTSVKNSEPLSIIMFDIDHFKAVNDKFGHDIGDKTITAVAKLGRETMRSKDIFSRLGGEEFAAILPATNLDEAKAVAERFREKVELYRVKSSQGDHSISISAGVVTLSEKLKDFDALLNAADKAMYKAKRAGRNKVCCV